MCIDHLSDILIVLFVTMVQINRSNMQRRGRGGNTFIGKIQNFADGLPFISQLSPIDRLLALVGVSLFGVVSFSYFFLISGIFSSSSLSGGGTSFLGGGASSDPRLSSELRKTGLSEEALLRRGGGKRISIGPKALDSNENAVALDIISALNCDALQEELEREWHTVLDEMKNEKKWENSWESNGGFGGWNSNSNNNENNYENNAGKFDDFAGELAGEVEEVGFGREQAGDEQSPDGNEPPPGDEPLDDFMNRRRRRLLLDEEADNFDDLGMHDDLKYNGDSSSYNNHGLKLTARHLFCLAAGALTLPKSTSESIPDPSTQCDISSMDVRDELLYLWSSARSQMPEDVLIKTLKLVTEHKETLRGHEVHIWYPEGDKGTAGMLNVLNSGYEGRQTYNFDSEQADYSHDDMYRFHDCK